MGIGSQSYIGWEQAMRYFCGKTNQLKSRLKEAWSRTSVLHLPQHGGRRIRCESPTCWLRRVRQQSMSASLIDWCAAFPTRRDPTKLSGMIRARTFAISCGYEDADDFMRTDPGFKLACGKLPDAG